jgi:peptidyl-prolyl cis-trans isomerase D
LGGLLLVGLAGFGISNVIVDLGSTDLAKVGDETISIPDFQRAYQQQLNQYAQQTGQMPTGAQALQLGIPSAVLGKLASDAAINQFAVKQGMGVSDARLAKMVRDDPSFFGVLGTFDRSNFESVLRQNGYTEAQYFELQTRAARRQQIALGLFAGSAVPTTAETLLYRYRNDTRTVEYYTLSATSLPDIAAPTDEDLKKYLTDHQTDFRTKETRTADVLALNPEVLAGQPDYQPTEAEIKAEYERTKASLTSVEKRDVQQVVLTDPGKEVFFKPGTSFDDAVTAAGLKATDFGLVAKTDLQDPALADAAFAIAKEGDFAIIPGIGGKRVVGVTKINPGGQTTYDDAKAAIAKSLALTKAKNAYADVQDEVESLRAGMKPLKDIADRYKLKVTTVAITAGGAELKDVPGLAAENDTKVATAIFAATQGKLAPTVSIAANDNVWFDLSKVDPARDQTLDEVKDALVTAWTNEKTDQALQAEVKSITTDLDAGKSFQDVATAHHQVATLSQPITRDGDKTKVLSEQVANQIFSAGPDSHGSAKDGDYLLYHVVDIQPAAGKPDSKIADFLKTSNQDALYAEFIGGIRDEAGLHINQQALSQALNLDQPTQ